MLIFITNSYTYPISLLIINSIQFILICIIAFVFIKNRVEHEKTQSELFTTELHNKTLVGLVDGVRTLKHDQNNIIQSLNGYMLTKQYIENILALRGDMVEGMDKSHLEYHYASELTSDIVRYGGFCIGGACYPENHPESENSAKDIESLRIKVACGCEFLTTQMFFDNEVMYSFLSKFQRKGINIPVIAGIMLILMGLFKLGSLIKFILQGNKHKPVLICHAPCCFTTELKL